jgi:hypothetical protein
MAATQAHLSLGSSINVSEGGAHGISSEYSTKPP